MRIWWLISIVLTVLAVVFGGSSVAALAEGTIHYDVKEQPFSFDAEPCRGYKLTISVASEQRKACVYQGDNFRFAVYTGSRGWVQTAVSTGMNKPYYPVGGLCDRLEKCVYSPKYDRVLASAQMSGGHQRLVVASSLSSQLSLNMLGVEPDYDYTGQAESAFPFINSTLAVGSLAVSANQRWAVVELINKGLAVIDLETMQSKRIVAPGYQYGKGSDPSYQLAVSDSGKSVLMTGRNVGYGVYTITDECGEEIGNAPLSSRLATGVTACKYRGFDLSNYLPAIFKTGIPYLSQDDSLAMFLVNTKDGRNWSVRAGTLVDSVISPPALLSLGDSFSSGEGEVSDEWYRPGTNSPPDSCHLSLRSYPFLVAANLSLHPNHSHTVACSGATTHDITGSSDYMGQGGRLNLFPNDIVEQLKADALNDFIPGRVAQLDFVSLIQPRIVTVGIGGNDAGFMKKLAACAMPSTCDWAEPGDTRAQAAKELRSLYSVLVSTYKQITQQSPQSRVYAVGYPKVIDPLGKCDAVTSLLLNSQEREFMDQGVAYLNQIIQAAALTAGVAYVDVEDAFVGKNLCTDNAVAMNGFRLGDDITLGKIIPLRLIGNETFHPTPTGHQLIAQRVIDQYPNLIDAPLCGPSQTVCAVFTPAPEPPAYWQTAVNQDLPDLIAGDIATAQGNTVKLSLPASSFAPLSSVAVSIHSTPAQLGNYPVSSDGSITAEFQLPSDFEEGIHTVHVVGVSKYDEPVQYYDIVAIEHTRENRVISSNHAALEPLVTTLEHVQPNSSYSETGAGVNSSGSGVGVYNFATLGVSDNSVSATDLGPPKAVDIYVVAAAIAGGMGVLALVTAAIWRRLSN